MPLLDRELGHLGGGGHRSGRRRRGLYKTPAHHGGDRQGTHSASYRLQAVVQGVHRVHGPSPVVTPRSAPCISSSSGVVYDYITTLVSSPITKKFFRRRVGRGFE